MSVMRKVSARTEAALEAVYSAFTQNGAPQRIVVCPCCVSADELKVMTRTRLRDLTWEQLERYLSAVFLTSGGQQDFRYFLPRLLDLTAHVEWDFMANWEILLGKLSLGEWQTWPPRERAALMEFLPASFEDLVADGETSGDEIDGFLCGLARGGVDLTPYLDRLSQPDADAAFFALSDENAASMMKGKLSNSFWKDHRAAGEPIRLWLLSEANEARLAQRWAV
jgi:hypothetical protein